MTAKTPAPSPCAGCPTPCPPPRCDAGIPRHGVGGSLPWGPSAARDPHGPVVRGGGGDGGMSADQGPPLGLPRFVDGEGRLPIRFPLLTAVGRGRGRGSPGQRERARG